MHWSSFKIVFWKWMSWNKTVWDTWLKKQTRFKLILFSVLSIRIQCMELISRLNCWWRLRLSALKSLLFVHPWAHCHKILNETGPKHQQILIGCIKRRIRQIIANGGNRNIPDWQLEWMKIFLNHSHHTYTPLYNELQSNRIIIYQLIL